MCGHRLLLRSLCLVATAWFLEHEEACVPCVSTEVAHLHRRACTTARMPKSAGLVCESGVADLKLENPAAPRPQALVARQCSVFLVPRMSRRSVALEIRSEAKAFWACGGRCQGAHVCALASSPDGIVRGSRSIPAVGKRKHVRPLEGKQHMEP